MRLPTFVLIGLGALVAAGGISWLISVISALSSLAFTPVWLISAVLVGARGAAIAIVAAALVWNQRMPLLIGWIVAFASTLASLISLVALAAADGGGAAISDLLWTLGFAGAGVMALLLWLRTAPAKPATQNPWQQPEQAYAAAVQQPWATPSGTPAAQQSAYPGAQTGAQQPIQNPAQTQTWGSQPPQSGWQ